MGNAGAPVLEPPTSSETDGATACELEQVLSSRAFEKTPTLRRLLTYLWEHRTEDINEYAIATEALGRKADFEPRLDATIRVLVSRLRQRLKEFYEADGASLPTQIVIPVGSHKLQVVPVNVQDSSEVAEAIPPNLDTAAPKSWWRSRQMIIAQLSLILLLVLSNSWLLWERGQILEDAERGATTKLPAFWTHFLRNGKNTRIVLPTPIFFGWGNGLLARDVNVNDYSKFSDSLMLSSLDKQFGRPELAQQYLAASDVFASRRLDHFLDPQGTRITLSTTADSPVDTLERENLIAAGTPRTLAPFQNMLDRLSFQVDANKEQVVDRHPAAGSPSSFGTVHESNTRFTTHGVIASLPGGPRGTHVLFIVTTYYTSALVSYLTSDNGLKELQDAQHAHGDCPYFEAVILSEIDGVTELKSKLVAFKAYRQNP